MSLAFIKDNNFATYYSLYRAVRDILVDFKVISYLLYIQDEPRI